MGPMFLSASTLLSGRSLCLHPPVRSLACKLSTFHFYPSMHKIQSCSGRFLAISSLSLILLPTLASSTCTCEAEDKAKYQNSTEALKYKVVAIGSILAASALGVCLPFLVRNIKQLQPDGRPFFLMKAFAAGVILATGFIHILPDAFESLTSPCLAENPWHNFPFTSFVAMMAALGTLMMESFATGYHRRIEMTKSQPLNAIDEEISGPDANNGAHPHLHGYASSLELHQVNSSQLIRERVVSQVLELGIVVHSVIIGISLGSSENPKTIKPLVAALSFHQFFEGIGLGGCISQAKFKPRAVAIMVLFFSLTTPTGIAVGIGISNVYNKNSPTALAVQGLLNAASAGILIYMALVDLLANDFMNPKMLTDFRLQLGANLTLLSGACCMSLLAKLDDN